ncbi:MAG: sigma-70 family RNA polymerase sigma factor [Planctomycetota bacterium]
MNGLSIILASDDSELIEKAQGGDAAAFGQLVVNYQLDIRCFLRSRLRDPACADDLAQDVFLAAMTSIPNLKEAKSIKSWLLSIARFKLIDYCRKQSRQKISFDTEVTLQLVQTEKIETDQDQNEIILQLKRCIGTLSEKHRVYIKKYYFEKVSATDLANQSNQQPGTIRMTLLRIRKALAKCIRKQLPQIDCHE